MKTIRKIARNPFSIFFMISTVTLFSCGPDAIRAQTNQFTGKELMQAVYFLDGDAMELIEPLKEVKLETIFGTEKIDKIRIQISSILDQFELKYPGTFQEFKANITSGDHMLIEETIRSNAKLLIDFLHENPEIKEYSESLKSSERPLASLIDEHFPNKTSKLNASDVKETLNSSEFKNDFANYFDNLDRQLGKGAGTAKEDACVTIGAAVVVVAAIAVLVIYVVAILNAAAVANVLAVTWFEDDDEEPVARKGALLRDEITNSIAVNWAGIE